MKVGIIDAELCYTKKHRFPNLACMKLSAYHKELGDDVTLVLDDAVWEYDLVYLSKVFTETEVPPLLYAYGNIQTGGTGFDYHKAESLPYEVEHHMPDYDLYTDWVNDKLEAGEPASSLKFFTDYSIGFLTRGCFRKCEFCVNRDSDRAVPASPLSEFYDPSRKKICLLDDNFLACASWKEMLKELQATGKTFVFKQGLDERIINDERAELLFESKYDGDFIFAFDNIDDSELIEKKLRLIRKHSTKRLKFYVLVGYDRSSTYDSTFYKQDVIDAFERIKLLGKWGCIPYIMRHADYEQSPYRGTFINLASWCNQPAVFKNFSYREFCTHEQRKGKATERYFTKMLKEIPDAEKYVDMRWEPYKSGEVE